MPAFDHVIPVDPSSQGLAGIMRPALRQAQTQMLLETLRFMVERVSTRPLESHQDPGNERSPACKKNAIAPNTVTLPDGGDRFKLCWIVQLGS